jgi:hypothetical protein
MKTLAADRAVSAERALNTAIVIDPRSLNTGRFH